MLGGGDNESSLGRMSMLGGSSLPLQLNPAPAPATATATSKGRDERVPQWSVQETRDLIAIRAELERDFNLAKRNKILWEAVAARMKERGYRRSPDQCKCKWKNLVNKYKGKETSDPENGRLCPFFEELHAVYTERAKNMHRLPLESEAGSMQGKKRVKRPGGDATSDDLSEDEDDDEDASDEERLTRSSNPRKRKAEKERQLRAAAIDKSSRPYNSTGNLNSGGSIGSGSSGGGIKEMLQELFQQQQRMEMQWRESMERRAHERLLFEQEWRQSMEKLEREKLLIEQSWREREEQRRMREESRAEKRDALLTTLLNKLIHDSHL